MTPKLSQSVAADTEARIKVLRFNPSLGGKPSYQTYAVPTKRGMTVLSALIYAKERLDPTLAIRFSCRMASCGSCGMRINGLPRLACYTLMSELKSKEIVVEPLGNFTPVRDLVPDLTDFLSKPKKLKLHLTREGFDEQAAGVTQTLQSDEELLRYIQFAYCIRCGLCNAACPVAATDKVFPGPQALAHIYRYYNDSRDQGGTSRLDLLDGAHGLLRCHFAGSCSKVCPKGVDPALAIQLLRREMLFGPRKH